MLRITAGRPLSQQQRLSRKIVVMRVFLHPTVLAECGRINTLSIAQSGLWGGSGSGLG